MIDGESEKHYRQQRIPILPSSAVPHNLPHRARKLQLISDSAGFGFVHRLEKTAPGRTCKRADRTNLQNFLRKVSLTKTPELGITGHVLRELESGRPAERAGLKDGDLLLEVNGESVESLKHQEVVERVRQSGQKVSVTTITLRGLEFYTKVGVCGAA